MTTLNMPLTEMMSTRTEPLEYVDVFGKVWEEFPGWKPGDPWEDRWILPEDEGYATLGWQIIEWLQTYVQSPNGDGPCRLTPEQQRFILHWYSFDPETEMPRYRSGVFVRPKGPVCDDEQVPTPQGLVRHGDLKVGDEVYASDGSITTVTAVIDSGVEDESCLVEFSDGAPIAVSLDHRIPVDEFVGSGRARTVATPREMLEKGLTFERKLTKGAKGGVSRYRVLRSPAREERVVTGITPIGRRPVSCIEVAHPSHEYLVGESAIPVCNSGKDPLAAMICIVEFVGPCRLLGWGASGEPIAGPHPNPLVQLAAVSKEQNTNTVSLFPVMMDQEFQDMFDVNIGVEVSYAQKRKCTLKALTSNFRTQEGARPSCVIENEVHHWLESQGGTDFHAVLGRNLVKRGHADPFARRLCITNAYKPSEESVARNIREGIEDALAGRYVDTGTLMYDSIEVRADVSLRPPAELCSDVDDEGNPRPTLEDRIQWLMRLLREVRGDAFWLNLRQTAEEILSPENQHALSDMRRFYLNQVTAADEAWLDRKDIIAAIDPEVEERRRSADSGMDSFEVGWLRVDPDEPIVMFFDGSKSDDATGLVGCRVSDGYTFTLGVWQRPTNLPDDEKARWRVDRSAVDRRVDQVFRRFNVVAFFGDPSHAKDEVDYTPYWDALMDEWHRKYSDQLQVWAVNSQQQGVHAIMWDMTSPQRTAQFVAAAQKTVEDFESLDITIDGHPALVKHLTNAQEREDEKNGITLGKESRYSPRKIDLAVCLVGARMLRRVVKLAGLDNDKAASWFAG